MDNMINDKHKADIENKASMIWSIADRLRGQYKAHEYGLVILPFTVLRRFDCALINKRPEIYKAYENYSKFNLPQEKMDVLLNQVSGLGYYDINQDDLRSVLDNPKEVGGALRRFINNFSSNVREIMEELKIYDQIERLEASAGNLLYAVVDEITQSKNDLSPEAVNDIDMGYIFEHLVRKFSESANEEAGEHYTPRDAIDLMVNILFRDSDKNELKEVVRTILDPACGTGGMLSESTRVMKEINGKINLHCYGQEFNAQTYAICRANALIKDPAYSSYFDIRKGDTLGDYKFWIRDTDTGLKTPQKFNYIISNPPFGGDWKNSQKAVVNESADLVNGRFKYGLPAIGDSQMLFLSIAAASMEDPFEGNMTGGRVAIIQNGSPLFNGDAGSGPSEIRRHLLEEDYVDAIIALPENIFYNTGIGTYIWVLDNKKEEKRKGKVQLIDASSMYNPRQKSAGNKRVDIDENAKLIIEQAYREYENKTYGDKEPRTGRDRVCESKIVNASEFGFVKVSVLVPETDENGNVKRNTHGKVIFDKKKTDSETIPLGIIELDPKKDLLKDQQVKKTIEEYMEKEVRPYLKSAEIDEKKSSIGYKIPFNQYFYKYVPPRSSDEIKAEIKELQSKIDQLMKELE